MVAFRQPRYSPGLASCALLKRPHLAGSGRAKSNRDLQGCVLSRRSSLPPPPIAQPRDMLHAFRSGSDRYYLQTLLEQNPGRREAAAEYKVRQSPMREQIAVASFGWLARASILLVIASGGVGCRVKRATQEEFNRELSVRTDSTTGMPTGVDARPNVNVPIGEFWTRYEQFLRVPPSALVRGPKRPDRLGHGTLSFFQQVHLGYPVANGGYLVETEREMFRTATGKFILGLPASLPRPIRRGPAIDAAVRSLMLEGPLPWTTPAAKSAGYHPPVATLSLAPEGVDGSFKLIWYVSFASTGLANRDVGAIVVDAGTGAIIGTFAGRIR
jgi:hypothetical protein